LKITDKHHTAVRIYHTKVHCSSTLFWHLLYRIALIHFTFCFWISVHYHPWPIYISIYFGFYGKMDVSIIVSIPKIVQVPLPKSQQ